MKNRWIERAESCLIPCGNQRWRLTAFSTDNIKQGRKQGMPVALTSIYLLDFRLCLRPYSDNKTFAVKKKKKKKVR